MRQNAAELGWALGYNAIALPIADGAFEPAFGLVLRSEISALSMSGSSFMVAVNALLLKRPPCPSRPHDRPTATHPKGTRMKKMTALLALLLAAVLTIAACGSDETTSSKGGSSSATSHNDADVTFARDMIPHHEQAVQMSKMAATHAQSAEVKQLASDIDSAQGPEIDTMTKWLETWGEDTPSDSMDHGDMGHGSDSEMPGMMDEDELGKLDQAQGSDWDQMFLTMMIKHHEGAIEMAKTEQADGKNGDAIALAKKIEDAQTSEIAKMKTMLNS